MCGAVTEAGPYHVCEQCFGPLEVVYDLEGLRGVLTREEIGRRRTDLWRYRELLPVAEEPTRGIGVGWTPLLRAPRLGEALGVPDLWIKVDASNHPTQSFKDRVVAVALQRAKEFGIDVVGCASTGNLANAVAAQAAAAGLGAWIFIPEDLEEQKIIATGVHGVHLVRVKGVYDDVNRLCAEVADRFSWGIVNVNLRAYYSEGSKTMGFEIAEQLGWSLPANVVTPMAGGSLITKLRKAFKELTAVGLVPEAPEPRFFGAQPSGCAPIVSAVLRGGRPDHAGPRAEHDRPLSGDRQSGGRHLRDGHHARDGGLGGRSFGRRDRRGDPAARHARGRLHGDGRRGHGGSGPQAGPARQAGRGRANRDLHHRQRTEDPRGGTLHVGARRSGRTQALRSGAACGLPLGIAHAD